MRAALIVPDKGNRHGDFIREHYFGLAPIVTATDDSLIWSKARAVNRGVRSCDAEMLFIVDADIVFPPEELMRAAEAGDWVIPYGLCIDLSPDASQRLRTARESGPFTLAEGDVLKERHKRRYAGGLWIIRREIFEMVGGLDERFVGWGGEDEAFCRAVNTLHEPAVMLPGTVFHLYHEPDPTKTQFKRRGNWRLFMKYRSATGKPERMRRLVEDSIEHSHANRGAA